MAFPSRNGLLQLSQSPIISKKRNLQWPSHLRMDCYLVVLLCAETAFLQIFNILMILLHQIFHALCCCIT